jgi:hypothetical protein
LEKLKKRGIIGLEKLKKYHVNRLEKLKKRGIIGLEKLK